MSNEVRFNLSEKDLKKLGVSEINIKDLKRISGIKTLDIIGDLYESINEYVTLRDICEEIYLMWGAHRSLANIDSFVIEALEKGYKLKKFKLSGKILDSILPSLLNELAIHIYDELSDIKKYIKYEEEYTGR